MTNLWSVLARLYGEETGQGLVEYVLIMALIALGALAGMSTLATSVNSTFTKVGSVFVKSLT